MLYTEWSIYIYTYISTYCSLHLFIFYIIYFLRQFSLLLFVVFPFLANANKTFLKQLGIYDLANFYIAEKFN